MKFVKVYFSEQEQQLQVSKLNGRHNSYLENKEAKKGCSWKLQMMTDITAIRQMAETKEEFIELMNDYGYNIVKETKQSITWINHTTSKKIRDTTLGQEFTMNFLFPEHTPTIPVKKFEKE